MISFLPDEDGDRRTVERKTLPFPCPVFLTAPDLNLDLIIAQEPETEVGGEDVATHSSFSLENMLVLFKPFLPN